MTRAEINERMKAAGRWPEYVKLRDQFTREGMKPAEARREAYERIEANGHAPAVSKPKSRPMPDDDDDDLPDADDEQEYDDEQENGEMPANWPNEFDEQAWLVLEAMLQINDRLKEMRERAKRVAAEVERVAAEGPLAAAFEKLLRQMIRNFAVEFPAAKAEYWRTAKRLGYPDDELNNKIAVAGYLFEDHPELALPAERQQPQEAGASV